MNLKRVLLWTLNMFEWTSKGPQHAIFQENLNLQCFYLVIQVGSTEMSNIFILTSTCLTWKSKVTSTQRSFWSHESAENFKIMAWIQGLPQCLLIFFFQKVYFLQSNPCVLKWFWWKVKILCNCSFNFYESFGCSSFFFSFFFYQFYETI